MQDFFMADPHLGHKNIIKFCNRPFSTIEEQDDTIIDNINQVVGANRLYMIGDFSFKGGRVGKYIKRIKAKEIHLIVGNHDEMALKEKKLFTSVCGLREVWLPDPEAWKGRRKAHLCHWPMLSWIDSHYGESCQLHGHHHGMWYDDWPELIKRLQIDVGVDSHGFLPWSVPELIAELRMRTPPPPPKPR